MHFGWISLGSTQIKRVGTGRFDDSRPEDGRIIPELLVKKADKDRRPYIDGKCPRDFYQSWRLSRSELDKESFRGSQTAQNISF